MKMKKIVSAVSALTMAVSAFASMTVANAAELEEVAFIGSSTAVETFDEYDGANWTTTAANDDNNYMKAVGVTEVAKVEIGATVETNPTYVSGNTWTVQGRNENQTATYTLPSAVRNGVVYFNTDAVCTTSYVQDGASIVFKDASGNQVAKLQISGANNDYTGKTTLTGATSDGLSYASSIRKLGSPAGFHIDTIIDLDNSTMTLTYDSTNHVNKVRATDTMTVEIEEGSSIGSIELNVETKRSRCNAAIGIDNTQLYAMTAAEAVTETSVTVNKVDTDGNTLNTETITGLVAGDAYVADDLTYDEVIADGVKYVYTYTETGSTASIDALSATAEENIITLVFEKTAKQPVSSVTINYVADGTVISTETKSLSDVYVDDVVSVGYRKYIFVDGVLYNIAKNSSNPHYGRSVTLAENATIQVEMSVVTPAEGTEFVAVVDGDGDAGNAADIRASNMSAARGDLELGNVEPGIYTITYMQYIRGGSPVLYLDDVEVCALNKHENSWDEATTENIEITAAGNLVIKNVDMTDYVLLIKTADLTPALPESVEAVLAEDFNDTTLTDAQGASVWKATIEDTDVAYNTITATATGTDDVEASASFNATTITTAGAVDVIVIVNRMAELLKSVVLSVE